ncbi:MAG: hypothetical protein R3B95_21620 [Nitrospirales bacterium]|nr:hypothetical protein [Nitrospirales bacterium]
MAQLRDIFFPAQPGQHNPNLLFGTKLPVRRWVEDPHQIVGFIFGFWFCLPYRSIQVYEESNTSP